MASTPIAGTAGLPLLWQGAERIGVQCLVQVDGAVDQPGAARLCERARAIAAEGAPAPVEIVAPGDPAILDRGTVTLLLHVSIESHDGRGLAALSLRPFRNAPEAAQLFGAAPRAVRLAAGADLVAALEPPLAAALNETLPWRAAPPAPRPIQN